jgi:endonuclease III
LHLNEGSQIGSASFATPDLFIAEDKLRKRFGQPRHGNKREPVAELLYILLSLQTSETNCKRSYSALRRAFSRFSQLATARVSSIRKPIAFAGLGTQRAKKISTIVRRIKSDFGRVSLASLRQMPTADAEKYLTSLPGVGKKTARCVLMYSFGRAVFPLDTHCARILKRLGFEIPGGSLRRCEDKIQYAVPEPVRYSLHVTMISLGRTICTSINPGCDRCPLLDMCPTGRRRMNLTPQEHVA